jgi:hypothetical protein
MLEAITKAVIMGRRAMKRRKNAFVTLRLRHDTFRVDRRRILEAMKVFDKLFRVVEPTSGTKFAAFHNGQSYPPKRVLGLAVGRPTNAFSGGGFANSVFERLGFMVDRAPRLAARLRIRHDGPAPSIGKVVSRLFSEKWKKLDSTALGAPSLDDGDFPGIYVIAYSKEDLVGSRVREEAVFYVGMSNHAGLRSRLGQFLQGLEDGGHHSGAKRFFNKLARRTPYSRLSLRKNFLFACAPVPCETTKRERTPLDLRKMGVVAAAELYALARIRHRTGREPELNEQ